ncbi:unnamed protein product [Urochloa decumbens]|uniref:Uncharacterized protein n=1 Tax=Urochloa decumbens TaxID=240449 RepID=A0ABC9GDD3_9POAL
MEAAEASPLDVSPRAGSWRRSKTWSRSSSIGRSGSSSCGSGSIEYTSLRDVLEEEESGGAAAGGWGGIGGGWGEYSSHDIHDFDASNIGIRNQLLKHAASAYLQSAVVVAPGAGGGRDGEWSCCLARLWRRAAAGGGRRGGRGGGRGRVLVRACASCWQGCVDDPAAFVARSARRVAAFVVARVGAVWPAACRWNSSPRAVAAAYDDYRQADLASGCDRCIE